MPKPRGPCLAASIANCLTGQDTITEMIRKQTVLEATERRVCSIPCIPSLKVGFMALSGIISGLSRKQLRKPEPPGQCNEYVGTAFFFAV